jgi:hypothetical protein
MLRDSTVKKEYASIQAILGYITPGLLWQAAQPLLSLRMLCPGSTEVPANWSDLC